MDDEFTVFLFHPVNTTMMFSVVFEEWSKRDVTVCKNKKEGSFTALLHSK